MPPKGRPRKEAADEATQKKRDYQRNYQETRKAKITELTADIKKCQADLKEMKDTRQNLREMAREQLRANAEKKQVKKGNKMPAPSAIPL
tara:strand:+ start:766 stop:1035 length:270 start_codon:yes stop_codon:yes gene_type:complete